MDSVLKGSWPKAKSGTLSFSVADDRSNAADWPRLRPADQALVRLYL